MTAFARAADNETPNAILHTADLILASLRNLPSHANNYDVRNTDRRGKPANPDDHPLPSGKWGGTVTERAQDHIAPYTEAGLSTLVDGIGSLKDIERDLQIVEDGIHAAVSIIGINMSVRLIVSAIL
jgi:hypothetical protein